MLDHDVTDIEETVSSVASSLLSRARRNDQAAWDLLVELHAPLVYRWCRMRGLDSEEARDVGQEVFVAVAKNLDGFKRTEKEGTFRGWMRTITENRIRDHWRRHSNRPKPMEGIDAIAANQNESSEEEVGSDNNEVFARICEIAQGRVSQEHWEIFWQIVVDGRSPADVAADTGIKRSNVYMIKSRVLRILKGVSSQSTESEE